MVSSLELFKELLNNPMVVSSTMDYSDKVYGEFLNLGGCMDYSVVKPCRIIGWILRDFYTKSNKLMLNLHKYCLVSHFNFQSNTRVIYSSQGVDPYTQLNTRKESSFLNNIWNKMFSSSVEEETEPLKKHGFVNDFMTDVIKEMKSIETLFNVLDGFKTFKKINPPPHGFNEILFHVQSYPSVFSFTPLNDAILEPLEEFSDILTYHHNYAYNPDPLLPTTFPKIRKQFLGIEDEENFQKHYDHLIMYDWTSVVAGGWCEYWRYAVEYFTHSFYRLDTGEFIIMTTNPQD